MKKSIFKNRAVILLLTFFSLVNPNNYLDAFFLITLAGLIWGYVGHGKFPFLFSASILLIIGYFYITIPIFYLKPTTTYILIILGFIMGKALNGNKQDKLMIKILILIFIITSLFNSTKLRYYLETNPEIKTYTHDMGLYQKTYYLMKGGDDYYQAHKTALENQAFSSSVPKDVWSWRLPTIFYLWRVFPSIKNSSIFWFYISLASLALYATYQYSLKILTKNHSKFAIFAPAILMPYLHFAARDWTVLQVEWWSALFIIVGFWQFKNKKYLLTVLTFTLGLAIRELMLIPFLEIIFGYVAIKLFKLKKIKLPKQWWVFIVPVFFFILLLGFHAYSIDKIIGLKPEPFNPRLHGGLGLWHTTLAFGSWEYLLFSIKPTLLLLIASIFAVIVQIKFDGLMLLSFYFLPFSYLVIGTSSFNESWGVLYVSMIPLGVSWILKYFLSTNSQQIKQVSTASF